MTYRFINDLFPTKEELDHYYSHPFPFNLPLVKERLDKKIEENPEYEVFLPAVYAQCEYRIKGGGARVLEIPNWFVSNKGRIYSKNNGGFFIKPSMNTSGYKQVVCSISGKTINIVLHRLIGCCFVPLTDDVKQHPKYLEVNHINGDKLDLEIINLEWTTQTGNRNHAVKNGLAPSGKTHAETKPVKGRVIRGKFIGYEFVLFGGNNLEQYGFDQAAVSNAANGKLKSHGNVQWVFATEEDIKSLPHELSAEIAKDLKDTCPIAKYKTIGVNIETGEIVEFIGKKKCKELGFNPEAIGNMIAGRTSSHKGHTWRYELLESGL